jgi:hypothetical protein
MTEMAVAMSTAAELHLLPTLRVLLNNGNVQRRHAGLFASYVLLLPAHRCPARWE